MPEVNQLVSANNKMLAKNHTLLTQNNKAIKTNSQSIKGNKASILENTKILKSNAKVLAENNKLLKANNALLTANNKLLTKIAEKLGIWALVPEAVVIIGGIWIFNIFDPPTFHRTDNSDKGSARIGKIVFDFRGNFRVEAPV
jgi:hypothetical protein